MKKEAIKEEKPEIKEHTLPQGIDLAQIKTAVVALIAHTSIKNEKSLFPESNSKILLDITTFKIPTGDNHFYPIVLPNSPYPTPSDILLIIPDDPKVEGKTEPETLVNDMKDKLASIDGFDIKIREIMTLRQLRDDYSTFEAKRALAKRIDLILADNRIFKNLSSILGREFYKKKKFPLGVDMEKDNLDEVFKFVLRKTVLNISTNGPTTTLSVGHSGLTVEQIVENISKVTNWIMRKYPGGWKNISKLSVAVSSSSSGIPPLVLYMGQGSRNEVTKPVRKGRKLPEPEEDELSTLPGRRVRVHPKGEIEVIKDEAMSDEETVQELGVDEEMKEMSEEPPAKKKKTNKKSKEKLSPTAEATTTIPTKKVKKSKSKIA